MDKYKEAVLKELIRVTGLKEIDLEIPPDINLGDYAFPCYVLSKSMKKNPLDIAQELKEKVKIGKVIKEVKAVGPYLNFFIEKSILTEDVVSKIEASKDKYGVGNEKEKIVIEFPAPNTNKPLHLGHVRNMLLGQSVSNILECVGNKVFRVNLNNDRGVHICKSMLAYKLYGEGKKPDIKSDHFVGKYYVLYSEKAKKNPELELEIQKMLQKWEAGDKETLALWKKMNRWAIDGFDETYKKLGIEFDKVYNESEHYKESKDIVENAFKKGIFKKDDDGNIVAELEKYKMPNKVLLRKDGTAIYMTQDINLAKLKFDDFKFDKSLYVVGNEQNLHFQILFKLLEILGYKFAKGCYHLSYGMIFLPSGKMKSREGTVVDADDLISNMVDLAKVEVRKRHEDLSSKEVDKRAHQIGMAALRFFILKYDPNKDFTFHPEESISFEGETGPYVQYSHARICSIFEKFKGKVSSVDYSLLEHKHEKRIIQLLSQYPAIVLDAAKHYKPSTVCRYLLYLAQAFNEFYHDCQILTAKDDLRDTRLKLIMAVKQVLKNGLSLLSIDAPEKM